MRARLIVSLGLAALAGTVRPPLSAQLPLSVAKSSGQSVTPAFEGWYRNSDGTFSLSFGYYNRNADEVVSVAIGAANRVEPGPPSQGQPTEFHPGRHWGVFAVKVPADFGTKEVTWTIVVRGTTYAIPGYLRPNWQIDALDGEAGSGNTPPGLKFDASGPEGRGPLGISAGPISASAGSPVTLRVWARDDGKPSGGVGRAGRGGMPVTITWFTHQSPAGARGVAFRPPSSSVDATGGQATSEATFSTPGEYVVRLRANDASGLAGAGHAQCCWTNAFLRVVVK